MGFSRLWLGPATKPSTEVVVSQVTLLGLARRPELIGAGTR
jgi:hypothetical protein